MLRVLMVVDPPGAAIPLVSRALVGVRPTAVMAPVSMSRAAQALAGSLSVAVTPDDRLLDGDRAVDLVRDAAANLDGVNPDGVIALVASEAVVRQIVIHALDAPVPAGRLALDPGAIAEVEVRLDAPWTVSRINDVCHLGTPYSARDGRDPFVLT